MLNQLLNDLQTQFKNIFPKFASDELNNMSACCCSIVSCTKTEKQESEE
jgi:hypothetical protein